MNYKRKIFLYFSFFAFSFSFTSAQSHKADSLLGVLKGAKQDTTRYNILLELGESFKNTNPDTAIYYYRQAFVIAENLKDVVRKGNALVCVGAANMAVGKYNMADSLFKEVLAFATSAAGTDAQKLKASVFGNAGILYYYESNYPQALDYCFKALKICEQLGIKSGQGRNLITIGVLYEHESNYPEALSYYFKALEIYQAMGNKDVQALCIGNIGVVYYEEKNYSKALEYYSKALKMAEDMGNKTNKALDLGNIGLVYTDEGDYSQALNYDLQALKTYQEINYKYGQANELGNIAFVYAKDNNFQQALEYDSQALKMDKEIDDINDVAIVLSNIGETYIKTKQYSLAGQYLGRALTLSDSIHTLNTTRIIESSYSVLDSALAKESQAKGQWHEAAAYLDSALVHYKKFITTRDSITNQKNIKNQAYLEANFEYQQKEAIEKAAQEKKDLAAQEARKQQKILIYSISGILLLVIAFAIFVVIRMRITHRQKRIIEIKSKETEEQKKIIEEKNKDILDSIHYAQRIQKALLASDKLLKENLPDYFVLFKPKDIVSGDFYWATRQNNRFYLAVCDSTGHGVPGAFMSLLNISYLNEGISDKDIVQPNEVFNHTRKRLIDNISQDGQQDGMDGILASLCPSEGGITLNYAAAYNPPVIVRNGTLIELPADKIPVGRSPMETTSFTHHSVKTEKGDTLYLFTDGYADQFGGPKGKKYKYKQLQEKLAAISNKPMEEQKKILDETLEEWKGNLEQVDDILVIGIRI